jgi:hypothetical protein
MTKVMLRWQGTPEATQIPSLFCDGLEASVRHEAGANFSYVTVAVKTGTVAGQKSSPAVMTAENIDAAIDLARQLGHEHNIHAEILVVVYDGLTIRERSLMGYLMDAFSELDRCGETMEKAARDLKRTRNIRVTNRETLGHHEIERIRTVLEHKAATLLHFLH